MNWLEALILGLIQGLTEYLPISSSGHLAIASTLFGINAEQSLTFTVMVHIATVCSTLVVLWKEIRWLLRGLFKIKLNDETKYTLAIIVSMVPVAIVGLFLRDAVEACFGTGLTLVGYMLLWTAFLLLFSYYKQTHTKERISLSDAFIIGIAQACAVLPGLSRSGATIATGLLLGNKKEILAQFSFLMVIPPILGEALLDCMNLARTGWQTGVSTLPITVGFVAAFVSGCVACKWMINLVRKGKLVYFAAYCAIISLITFFLG